MDELPRLLTGFQRPPGVIKDDYEDFVVEEVPLYEPCGDGTHVYFRIEKTGLPTMQAVHEIGRALGRPVRDIGYAGLKDARAVTRQMLSVEHVDGASLRSQCSDEIAPQKSRATGYEAALPIER